MCMPVSTSFWYAECCKSKGVTLIKARRQGQSISEMVQLAGNLSKYILTVVYIGKNHQALTRYWMAPVWECKKQMEAFLASPSH